MKMSFILSLSLFCLSLFFLPALTTSPKKSKWKMTEMTKSRRGKWWWWTMRQVATLIHLWCSQLCVCLAPHETQTILFLCCVEQAILYVVPVCTFFLFIGHQAQKEDEDKRQEGSCRSRWREEERKRKRTRGEVEVVRTGFCFFSPSFSSSSSPPSLLVPLKILRWRSWGWWWGVCMSRLSSALPIPLLSSSPLPANGDLVV